MATACKSKILLTTNQARRYRKPKYDDPHFRHNKKKFTLHIRHKRSRRKTCNWFSIAMMQHLFDTRGLRTSCYYHRRSQAQCTSSHHLNHPCQQDKPGPQFQRDTSPWLYTLLHSGVSAGSATERAPHGFCPRAPLPRHSYPTVRCRHHHRPGSVFNITLQFPLDG